MEEIKNDFPFKTLDEFNEWLKRLQQENTQLKAKEQSLREHVKGKIKVLPTLTTYFFEINGRYTSINEIKVQAYEDILSEMDKHNE